MIVLFRKFSIFMFLFIFLAIFIKSDDGMWMPHQMKDLNLKQKGLQMNPDNLYKKDGTGLMSAIVYLGGATGEFVSQNGLILTNHHVAFRAIQRASDKENDYIKNGFLAKNLEEEIPAKGYIADVLLGYTDITQTIKNKIKGQMTPLQKYKKLEKIKKEIIKKEEKKGDDIRCSIKSMYSGNKYYLFKFKRLRDIRLVYAPPKSLGNFGGDIDNWMWPRHTCDFSYLRAYVSKDNIGTTYDPKNIPYKPKSFLKISLDGVKNDDFTFVMGYPGRTYRNYTYAELKLDIKEMEQRLELYKDIINFFQNAGKNNRDVQIKYSSLIKGLNNGLKNRIGKLEGFKKRNILQKKKKSENDFKKWLDNKPKLNDKYVDILSKISTSAHKKFNFEQKMEALNNLKSSYMGSTILSQAYLIYRTVLEQQKPDDERESGFQERDLPYIKQRIKLAERSYDFNTDKSYFKYILNKHTKQNNKMFPEKLREIILSGQTSINNYVNKIYSNTILKDPNKRLELLELSPDDLLKTNDPFILLASEIEKKLKNLREREKALIQECRDYKKQYMKILLKKEDNIAPDANSSIRFTHGKVKGYSPSDAVIYSYITSLTGVIEKDTGKSPFNVPKKLKKLYKQKSFGIYKDKNINDIPVCFLNTTNVTGGNSGSPVLNTNGEQIGIVFDMTYESVIGDYFIIPELQRTINVDIRYIMFITEKFSGSTHLLKEIGIK